MYKTHNRKGGIHSKQKEKIEKTPQRSYCTTFVSPDCMQIAKKNLFRKPCSMIRTGNTNINKQNDIRQLKISYHRNITNTSSTSHQMINEARRYETTQKNKTFTLAFKTSNSV